MFQHAAFRLVFFVYVYPQNGDKRANLSIANNYISIFESIWLWKKPNKNLFKQNLMYTRRQSDCIFISGYS